MLKKFILAFMLMLALSAPAFATISSTNSRMDYTGNGAVDTYSYNFKIFSTSDLLVTVRDTNDVETTLTLTTDYTVTGAGGSGGNVVLVNSAQAWLDADGDLKSNYILTIRRVRQLKQLTDIRNQGAFYPETHENAFDHFVMIAQQHQDEIDRSMKLPETIDPSDFDTELPADLAANPGSSIIVNDDGDGFEAGPTADAISGAQANATAAAASASTASSQASAASASASAAAASAASVNLPSITGNSLNFLQANASGTALQYTDLRSPNVGIGTITPNAGKFTTLFTTGNVGIGTITASQALTVQGAIYSRSDGFRFPDNTTQTTSAVSVPSGVIAMWSGTIATIPSGWELSDGTCSITCPDLRDRMIIGATSDDSGAAKTNVTGSLTQTGGSAAKNLQHTHTVSNEGWGEGVSAASGRLLAGATDGGASSSTNGVTSGTGGSATQDVLNPYYALAFIIKI